MKLLIVDDSLVVRNAIERSVAHDRIDEILRAEDGTEPVELFRRHKPQLVTMDLTLPRLDGLGAILQIRAIDPHASILVISALNSHKTAMDAIRGGACGFLTKPFQEREVADAFVELVEHADRQPR